jgi:exonuclease SbcD
VHYSGAPLAVDFGEEENVPSVTIVSVGVDHAARTRDVPITAAVPLRTVRGTLDELGRLDGSTPGWLRVYVCERPRAGLREAVQEMLPNALEVRIDPDVLASVDPAARVPRQAGRTASELFSAYLDAQGHADTDVAELFDRLHGEVALPADIAPSADLTVPSPAAGNTVNRAGNPAAVRR